MVIKKPTNENAAEELTRSFTLDVKDEGAKDEN